MDICITRCLTSNRTLAYPLSGMLGCGAKSLCKSSTAAPACKLSTHHSNSHCRCAVNLLRHRGRWQVHGTLICVRCRSAHCSAPTAVLVSDSFGSTLKSSASNTFAVVFLWPPALHILIDAAQLVSQQGAYQPVSQLPNQPVSRLANHPVTKV